MIEATSSMLCGVCHLSLSVMFMQPNEILDQAGRAAIIELILATDMKAHFGLLARLQVGVYTSGSGAKPISPNS